MIRVTSLLIGVLLSLSVAPAFADQVYVGKVTLISQWMNPDGSKFRCSPSGSGRLTVSKNGLQYEGLTLGARAAGSFEADGQSFTLTGGRGPYETVSGYGKIDKNGVTLTLTSDNGYLRCTSIFTAGRQGTAQPPP